MAFKFSKQIVDFLGSSEGQDLLAQIASELTDNNQLGVISKYRNLYKADEIAGVIETILLRRKALLKFKNAQEMLFDKDGLEQASNEIVAQNKAKRFKDCKVVLELGCGIGGDTIALAENVSQKLISYEKDPIRTLMCRYNLAVNGHICSEGPDIASRPYGGNSECEFNNFSNSKTVEIFNEDFMNIKLPECDAIYIDPARRSGEKRKFDPEEYFPPLSYISTLLKHYPNICVKVSPGIDHEILRETLGNFEVEIVSYKGDCKEALLWFGNLKSSCERSAKILPENITLKSVKGDENKMIILITEMKKYLYEPDPAIIRAHLVKELAGKYNCTFIDKEIAYLTGDELKKTPMMEAYKVLEFLPMDLRKLRKALEGRGIRSLTVKKRGFSSSPQEFLKKLGIKEGSQAILFITFAQGKHVAVLTEKIDFVV